MLAHLKGIVTQKSFNPNLCVLDVKGIGFTLSISQRSLQELKLNEEAKLFTSLSISQDNVRIFGFRFLWEQKLFEILSQVKGIGGKSALAIIDAIPPQQILSAIQGDSPEILASAPGIGKKTAERIIFELKVKVQELQILLSGNTADSALDNALDLTAFGEVSSILQSLGYNALEIDKALKANLSSSEQDVQETLKNCLKWLNSN